MPRRIGLGVVTGLGLLLVLDAVAVRAGVASGIVPRIAGPTLWIASRAAGITALVALTLEMLFGLFVSTAAADRVVPRARSVEVHRWLASVTVALIFAHALALLGDGFFRFDVVSVLIPFLSPYRAFAVGLGVLAAHAALVVQLSSWLRRRIGAGTWRRLHQLSFFAFAAGLVHAVLAGSDSASTPLRLFYFVSFALVATLVLWRFLGPRAARAGTPRAGRSP